MCIRDSCAVNHKGGTVSGAEIGDRVTISGSAFLLGALVGDNSGTVADAEVVQQPEYDVSASALQVGGAVGINRPGGTVRSVRVTSDFKGFSRYQYLGGVVGQNCAPSSDGTAAGKVENCTYSGAITEGKSAAANCYGGIAGVNGGLLSGNTVSALTLTADGTLHRTGERCAAFWDTDSSCANCISSRAFAEHTTLNKLEFTRNEMYFVIARYVSVNGTPCVLEMVSRLNEGRWIDANGSRFLLDRTRGEDMQLFLDPLTGVYARRYFETYRTHLEGMEGVALIDVNSFKHINDTCGHAAGDAALRDIAGAIRSCIRKTDILIRYGGDEFLLLFPRMTEEIFLEKKKQIQQAVRGIRMSEFADIQLSVSVGGVCGVHPITEAIRKADYLMYLDKAEQQP